MLKIGDPAPLFCLTDHNGRKFNLQDLIGDKNIVLYFYPKDDTPACTKEACFFRDQYEAFTDAGAEVIGISRDSVDSHQKFANRQKLPFILLSDNESRVHNAYGVSIKFFGIYSSRITFVIDKQGIIRNKFNSALKVARHVDEALEKIRELN